MTEYQTLTRLVTTGYEYDEYAGRSRHCVKYDGVRLYWTDREHEQRTFYSGLLAILYRVDQAIRPLYEMPLVDPKADAGQMLLAAMKDEGRRRGRPGDRRPDQGGVRR